MSRRDPLVYVRHMLDHAREACEMSLERSRPELDSDRLLRYSLLHLMAVIGEAAARIPDEFRSQHSIVPWRGTINLRNHLVHGYDQIDYDALWEIVQNDLPPLIEQLKAIVDE